MILLYPNHNFIRRLVLTILTVSLVLFAFRTDASAFGENAPETGSFMEMPENSAHQTLSRDSASPAEPVFHDSCPLHAPLFRNRGHAVKDLEGNVRISPALRAAFPYRLLLTGFKRPYGRERAVLTDSLRAIIRFEQRQDGRKPDHGRKNLLDPVTERPVTGFTGRGTASAFLRLVRTSG